MYHKKDVMLQSSTQEGSQNERSWSETRVSLTPLFAGLIAIWKLIAVDPTDRHKLTSKTGYYWPPPGLEE
jgi:hypothetical protein